jgi:hypothetical protein
VKGWSCASGLTGISGECRYAEDLIADREPRDPRAGGLDLSRELHAENPLPGAKQTGEDTNEERLLRSASRNPFS